MIRKQVGRPTRTRDRPVIISVATFSLLLCTRAFVGVPAQNNWSAARQQEPSQVSRQAGENRRSRRVAVSILPLTWFFGSSSAHAFENETPESRDYDTSKFRVSGVRAGDLGLMIRRLSGFGPKAPRTKEPALKGCLPKALDCLSTTADPKDSSTTTQLMPWIPPPNTSPNEATQAIGSIVLKYPPGQNGVDAGGFQVAEVKPGYLYCQFQSLQGLIDDVEFSAVVGGGAVLVRSASRVTSNTAGEQMFSSGLSRTEGNAKRLNYISAELRKLGWTALEITSETHPYYFKENGL